MIVLRFKNSSWNAPVVHKIDKFPCSIGRSIQNTIVLADDSVSAEHAVIERRDDGSFILRDLKSTNGILSEGTRFDQILLHDQGIVKCGDIEMTTLLSDERLEKTRQIELPAEFKTKTQKLAKSILIRLFLMAVFIFANMILSDPMDKEVWIDLLLNILLMSVVAFGVSGLIAIITKVQHKKYNYLHYLNITLLYTVLWGVYEIIHQRAFFWIDHRTLQLAIELGVFFCFFWFYFTQILEVFFSGRYRRKIQVTLGALYFSGVLFIYLIATTSERNTKFNYSAGFVYSTSEFSKEDYNFNKLSPK